MTITLCVFILSSRFFPLTFEENTVPYETPPRGSDTPVASFGGARRPAEPPVIRRSGRSAASPNRDFQLQASRGNNARDARSPHVAPAQSSRRPTSEVGSLLFCCTFAHRFRVSSFRFLVSGSFRSFTSPAIRHGSRTPFNHYKAKWAQINLSISMCPRQGESAWTRQSGRICEIRRRAF